MAIGKKDAKLLIALFDERPDTPSPEQQKALDKLRALATEPMTNKPTRLNPVYKR